MFSKFIKDICTLANGEDFDIAGTATLFAIILGFLIMGYVFLIVRPTAISDISEILKNFAIYHSSIITTGGTGKLLNNKAEPKNDSPNS